MRKSRGFVPSTLLDLDFIDLDFVDLDFVVFDGECHRRLRAHHLVAFLIPNGEDELQGRLGGRIFGDPEATLQIERLAVACEREGRVVILWELERIVEEKALVLYRDAISLER